MNNDGRGAADPRRRQYLKGVGGVVGAGTISSLAGCSSGGGDGNGTTSATDSGDGGYSKPIDQAFLSPDSLKIDLWKAFLSGMKEAANDFGMTGSAQDHGGQLSKQISQIQGAITSGADMVAATAPSDAGVQSISETAVDGGVPFFEYWSMGKWLFPSKVGPEFVQYQIPETFKAGAIPAKILFEEMGGEGNYVAILGPKGHIGSYRFEGAKQAQEDYPNINLLGSQYSGGWTRQKGREVMSSFISNHGDDIDGVYCNNGTLGLGAATVLSENDMALPFTGFDGALSNIEYIQNNGPDSGEPYQVQEQAAPPFWQGGWAVAKAWDWLHGWRPEIPERMMWTRTLTVLNPGLDQSKFSDLETTFATPDKYMSVAYNDGHSPYDWKLASVHESGEDWDPQHELVPIRKSEWNQLKWDDSNRPNGLSVPDAYDNADLFDQVAEDYHQRNMNGSNPYL
ncbi:sugar ABC transporter substrate-binding protein [Halarchaeum salinum]